jgi:hypothetical protein
VLYFSNKLDGTEAAVVSDEAQMSLSANDEPVQATAKKKATKLRVTKKKDLQATEVLISYPTLYFQLVYDE